ncbi:hypothetical protein [Salinicoccus sp. CNSTN-B1]
MYVVLKQEVEMANDREDLAFYFQTLDGRYLRPVGDEVEMKVEFLPRANDFITYNDRFYRVEAVMHWAEPIDVEEEEHTIIYMSKA